MSAISYTILVRTLIALHGNESVLAAAIGSDRKGYLSLAIYAAAIPTALYDGVLAFGMFILVALIWFAPDKRIEKKVGESKK